MWPKMEKLVNVGLTKFIGVSNYNVQNILIILSICKIKPVVNEVEFHPYLFQKDLKEFCDKEDIKIFSYNPLVKGGYCKKEMHQHIHLGVIPIPGTTNPKRMKENLESESFTMKDEDYNSINALCEKKEYRFCDSLGIYGIDIFA